MTLSHLREELLEMENTLPDPRLEVRVLLSHLGLSTIDQIAHGGVEIDSALINKAKTLFERRINGTPMAYITNEKEFYGHTFYVDESVLIPRPDTEVLVEKAVLAYRDKNYSGRILDLCTGSGAVAASIAYELKKSVCYSDISHEALVTAKRNYLDITGEEGDGREGDLFDPWKGERFSLIATNPPYLTSLWYEETDESVKKEPVSAFLGFGDDGLDMIKKIVSTSPQVLEKNGTLLIECDYRQVGELKSILGENGFEDIRTAKDLAGRERVVYGEYKG